MRNTIFTKLTLCYFLVASLCVCTLNAQQLDIPLSQVKNKTNKTDPMAKVGGKLAALSKEYEKITLDNPASRISGPKPGNTNIQVYDGYVIIDAVADENTEQLLADLKELGMKNPTSYGRIVSGLMPVNQISKMASLKSMRFARPAYKKAHIGAATTQGDKAQRSDIARNKFNIDGKNTKIGILSDSFDALEGAAEGVKSGDLPGEGNPNRYTTPVEVLSDYLQPDGSDEGRAIAEIIHDVAPGAALAFHTAFMGKADFAQGIIDLKEADCDLIIDDVFYYDEPFFQDGIIAQAVDYVASQGVSYFSAAGNNGRDSYESAFNPSDTGYVYAQQPGFEFVKAHSFVPGDDFQDITIPLFSTVTIVLQWDDPFYSVSGKGAKSDLDLFLLNDAATNVIDFSDAINIDGDPLEIIQYTNLGFQTTFKLLIEKYEGPNPRKMKYIIYGGSIKEYITASSTIVGHSNAASAIAVGAAFWGFTPEFGINTPIVQSFSSAGGTPILFDVEGNPVNMFRNKPEFTAPDGGNTSFFGQLIEFSLDSDTFPNFFGTSASAPHATAVAALMMEASNYSLTTAQIIENLQKTSIDMDDPFTPGFDAGYDLRTGSGFIQADQAIDAVFIGQRVVSFTLVNVLNGKDIMQIKEGDTINLSLLPTTLLNIRANTNPAKVGSVVFNLNDKQVTQNTPPYSLAGEYHTIFGIIYNPLIPPLQPGEYTLSATPYILSQGSGKAGAKETVHFTVVEEISVVSFTLINADTGEDLYELEHDMLLDLSTLPANLNIRAYTNSSRTGSVSFDLNGQRVTDNTPPYAFAGDYYDRGRKYRSMNPPLTAGEYTLSAAAHSGKFAGGVKGNEYVIAFTAVEGDILARKAFVTDRFVHPVSVSPNPSSGRFNVQLGRQGTQQANINIYNANGTLVRSYQQSGEFETEVNLSGMPAGLYMMKVEGNGSVQTIRLIKQ